MSSASKLVAFPRTEAPEFESIVKFHLLRQACCRGGTPARRVIIPRNSTATSAVHSQHGRAIS